MHQPKNFTLLLFIFLAIPSFAQISIGVKTGYSRGWEDYGSIEIPEDAVRFFPSQNRGLNVNFGYLINL